MPSSSLSRGGGRSSSSTSHPPAHQNAVAWRHNPKSKKTARILSLPIRHVCRRCREKLEWRKRYRKYKVRTVLGKCNMCHNRVITDAYHTICVACSATTPAKNTRSTISVLQEQETNISSKSHCNPPPTLMMVCCMCAKEPALEGAEKNTEGIIKKRVGNVLIDEHCDTMKTKNEQPLRLRQVKTLERHQQQQQKKMTNKKDENQKLELNDEDSSSELDLEYEQDQDQDHRSQEESEPEELEEESEEEESEQDEAIEPQVSSSLVVDTLLDREGVEKLHVAQ